MTGQGARLYTLSQSRRIPGYWRARGISSKYTPSSPPGPERLIVEHCNRLGSGPWPSPGTEGERERTLLTRHCACDAREEEEGTPPTTHKLGKQMWERTPQFKSHCRRVVCTDHRSAVPRLARVTAAGAPRGRRWTRARRRLLAAGESAEGAGSSALAAGANLTECVGASAEAHTSAGRDRDRAPLRSSTQLHDREP